MTLLSQVIVRASDPGSVFCRGLIHRTEDGLKHCMDRLAGLRMISSIQDSMSSQDGGYNANSAVLNEVNDFDRIREEGTTREHRENPPDDENDHFYYFDGVLRVKNNFYPYHKRERRRIRLRKRSNDDAESVFSRKKRDIHENLLSYIRHLTGRNKISQFLLKISKHCAGASNRK